MDSIESNPSPTDAASSAKPKSKHAEMLLATAARLGVPGNTALAQYVLILENRLETLEAKLEIKRLPKSAD